MKKHIVALAVLTVLICFAFHASAQEMKQFELNHDPKVGIDVGATPGGYSWGYNYTNNNGLYKSGTNYRNGRVLGGSGQFTERTGWITEVRYRLQSISNPLFWYSETGHPTYYYDGSSSNATTQYGGHFSALDVLQRIPVMQHTMAKHGLSLTAIAGLANDRTATHEVTVIFLGFQSGNRDDATIAQNFVGPKGGGRFEYATKRFAVATEATYGYLHTSGTYTDRQSESSGTGTVSYPTYMIGATTWSSEVNWRSTLVVPATSHFSVKLAYERRTLNTSNGDYIFGAPSVGMVPAGFSASQFTNSNPVTVGFVFRL